MHYQLKSTKICILFQQYQAHCQGEMRWKVFLLSVTKSLTFINESKHRSVQKLRMMQHLLLFGLCLPLLIYTIPMTAVVKLELRISNAMWQWLHLHNSTTNICLYSTVLPCPVPIKGWTLITKSAKLRGQLLLWESSDPFVSSASVFLSAAKWAATDAVANAETRLDFRKIMGYHQSHKAHFSSISTPEIPVKNPHAYQKLISSVQEETEVEKTLAMAVQHKLQSHGQNGVAMLEWICLGNRFWSCLPF